MVDVSSRDLKKNYHSPFARWASPGHIGLDLSHNPLDLFSNPRAMKVTILGMVHNTVVEVVWPILVRVMALTTSMWAPIPGGIVSAGWAWYWRRQSYLGLSYKLKVGCSLLQLWKQATWVWKVSVLVRVLLL